MQSVPPRPSLVTHSADFLRGVIRSGEWSDTLPSERSLCTRLRISRPTLRAVLTELENEGVISAVENKRRSILNTGKPRENVRTSTVIAMLSPVPIQLMPPFVLFWMDALRELLATSGFQLDVHVCAPCFSRRPAGRLKQLIQRVPAAAWVLFRSTRFMQEWFAEQRLPAIIAGSCARGVSMPSVDIDYRAACRHAATLLRQKGHQRIALLLPDAEHGGDAESELGFREALPSGEGGLVLRHSESSASVVAHVDQALSLKPRPTAFLVARSVHTLTVVTHLLRLGHRLPQEFDVVSRDDDSFLDHVVPRMTRYAADPAKFARRLSKLVSELAQTGRASSTPVRLMPDLCRGETV